MPVAYAVANGSLKLVLVGLLLLVLLHGEDVVEQPLEDHRVTVDGNVDLVVPDGDGGGRQDLDRIADFHDAALLPHDVLRAQGFRHQQPRRFQGQARRGA